VLNNNEIEFYPAKDWGFGGEPVYIGELKTKWKKGDPQPYDGFHTSIDGLCRPLNDVNKYGEYYVQQVLCPNYRYWITTVRVYVYKK